jgi:hypothetical protein
VAEYKTSRKVDRHEEIGLNTLLALVPAGERLGYIRNARNIMSLCGRREKEGIKRNSVRRRLLRVISKLLRHYYGNSERNGVFADVDVPAEDDRRRVSISPDEVKRLLAAAPAVGGHELKVIV